MGGVARVAGVDGCRAGWVVVAAPVALGTATVRTARALADVVRLVQAGELGAVAVDVPIGLGDTGPRACDREARAVLGPRRSSVFPAPVRTVLEAASWEDACARSRAAAGRAVSRQTWNIVPKVAEADRLLTPALADTVVEAHPEVAFALLAGEPMRHPKRSERGRDERAAALRPVFPGVDAAVAGRPPGAAVDDVLDAHVLAWTASRWAAGAARVLGDGAVDRRGLPLRIVA